MHLDVSIGVDNVHLYDVFCASPIVMGMGKKLVTVHGFRGSEVQRFRVKFLLLTFLTPNGEP